MKAENLFSIDEPLKYGLTWYLLSYVLTPAVKREPPHLIGDVTVAKYNGDGKIIFVGDCHLPCRVFAITRDYNIIWSKEGIDARGLDYSIVKNTLLIYQFARLPRQEHRIIELDASTGKLLHKLNSTSLGPIGNPIAATGIGCVSYHPEDHDKFWIVDSEHHTVYCSDWAGNVYYQFGTYNKPGDTGILLQTPISQIGMYNQPTDSKILLQNPAYVSPAIGHFGAILISDWANHRILNFSLKGEIHHVLPFPYPYATYVNETNCVAVFNGGNPTGGWYGVFLLGDSNTPVPRFYIPMNTNMVISHPKIPFRFLLAWDCSLYEIDFRDKIYREVPSAPPIQCCLFTNTKVTHNNHICSPPVVDWFRPNKTFIIKPTEDGRVFIEAARFTALDGNWDGGWEIIKTVNLKKDTVRPIFLPQPLGICRIKVELYSDGNVDGYVCLHG